MNVGCYLFIMFKELTYFEFLEDGLKALQDAKEGLNRRLIDAYSPPEKVFCSLKEQIDNILTEEEQLQQVLSVILQQI